MITRTIRIESQCDKTRFLVSLAKDEQIRGVAYRDMTLPRPYRHDKPLQRSAYPIAPNSQLLHADTPPDLQPDSEIAAFWFVRACYESIKRPVWFYYQPTRTLISFPPTPADGDLVIVDVVQEDVTPDDEEPVKPDSIAPTD